MSTAIEGLPNFCSYRPPVLGGERPKREGGEKGEKEKEREKINDSNSKIPPDNDRDSPALCPSSSLYLCLPLLIEITATGERRGKYLL